MQCQSCHKRKATVHETEISGNQKHEIHLCEQCAAKQQLGGIEIMGLLSGDLSAGPGSSSSAPVEHRCPACELEYKEFRASGRLGCPNCYAVFADALDPLLEKIHGQRHHVGKTPGESRRGDRSRERKLVELRRRLQTAVKEERYEEAAQVRDELQALEEVAAEDAAAAAEEGDPPPPEPHEAESDAAGSGDAPR